MASTHHFWSSLLIAAGGLALCATAAVAWPGFDWDTWREITGVEAAEIVSPQAGVSELAPLLIPDSGNGENPIQWEKRRAGIIKTLSALLGEPSEIRRDEVSAQRGEAIPDDGYTRIRVLIPGEADDPIPAWLLTPASPISTPTPVMIVLHQTQAPGKDEACGLTGDPEMAFAVELVQRGYICVAPDVIGFGERTPDGAEPYHGAHDFYHRHPRWSFFGKMNWDLGRVVDFIETLPEADGKRIGVIGHSHGAYGALMGAAFEPRISAVIASCGFTTLRSDPNPERWSHLTALLPRLGFYLDAIRKAPFDWHEVLACIAPRPLFCWATLEDAIFPNTDNLADVYEQVRQVYGAYDAAVHFEGRLAPGAHAFPKAMREEAYVWLEGHMSKCTF